MFIKRKMRNQFSILCIGPENPFSHGCLDFILSQCSVPEADVVKIPIEKISSSSISSCSNVERLRVVGKNRVIRLCCKFSVDVELLYFLLIVVGDANMLPVAFATLASPDGDVILVAIEEKGIVALFSRVSGNCLLYTSPSPRD